MRRLWLSKGPSHFQSQPLFWQVSLNLGFNIIIINERTLWDCVHLHIILTTLLQGGTLRREGSEAQNLELPKEIEQVVWTLLPLRCGFLMIIVLTYQGCKRVEMQPTQPVQTWELTAFLFSIFLFTAAPAAFGSSQARGRIRTAAAGLYHSHSNTRSELHLQLMPLLAARLDP